VSCTELLAAAAPAAPNVELTPLVAQEVTFQSGHVTLHGVLYMPEGPGPFPAMLYNHGSAPGMQNQQVFENLGPLFARRGWVFFGPYRRGQGLSASAGPYIVDAIGAAQARGVRRALPILISLIVSLLVVVLLVTRRRHPWVKGCAVFVALLIGTLAFYRVSLHVRASATVRQLETDALSDHMAAFEWLRQQSFVQPGHAATMGNSFGGIITVLGAERIGYCAAVDAAGGAQTWSPELRARLVTAVKNSQAPIFFFQAENDYTLAPTNILGEAMRKAGKPSVVKIYGPFGSTVEDGHSFPWRSSQTWARDVFRFLDAQCR
jgi:dienelactone hydrolase